MTNSRLPLEELLLSAVASYAKASPVERAIMALEQRRSYARSCCSSTISVEAAERILDDFPEFILLAAYRELHESHRELERKLVAYRDNASEKAAEPPGHTVIPCGTGLLCTACGMLFTNNRDDGIKTAFNASGPCPGLLADPLS